MNIIKKIFMFLKKYFYIYKYFLLVSFLLFFCVILGILPIGITYNLTDSMPEGYYFLYYPSFLKTGDIVSACAPTNKYSKMGYYYGWIPLNYDKSVVTHACYDNKFLPVIKRVYSFPGQTVYLTKDGFKNGKFFLKYHILKYTPGKNPVLIKHYPYGKYRVNGYFLFSIYSKLSYDSRYWGYVKHILYKCKYIGKKATIFNLLSAIL